MLAAVGLSVALTGCETWKDAVGENFFIFDDDQELEDGYGVVGTVTGFLGGVAADEPTAVLLARDVLSAGGTAADAATAMYFMMAVTKPSMAGLAGGGVCLAHDPETGQTEALDFLNRTPASSQTGGKSAIPVPGNPRGFAVLHARFGSLPWAQVIGPAEQAARFGVKASRAFGNDLRQYRSAVTASPRLRAMMTNQRTGQVIQEGDRYVFPGLAGTLGRLRARGGGEFYLGTLARKFIAEQAEAGGTLTAEDLREFRPVWRPALAVEWREESEFRLPPVPQTGGLAAAKAIGMLTVDDDYEDANPADQPHLLAEATRLGLAEARSLSAGQDLAATLTEDSLEALSERLQVSRRSSVPDAELAESRSGASLSVIDSLGGAVACTVTMNKPFGSGVVLPGMGMHLAAAPSIDGDGTETLVPVLLTSEFRKRVFFAGAASGGLAGITALIQTALDTGAVGAPLDEVVRRPRVYPAADAAVVRVEPEIASDIRQSLESKGHRVEVASDPARLNAVYCPNGIPSKNQICSARSDTRGAGLFITNN